jgi:hypothetical protein
MRRETTVSRLVRLVLPALMRLRQLGFRSRPVWQMFRRTGTVTAEQRDTSWTWTAHSGETMQAEAGDWAVADGGGGTWSVRDDIFRASYQHINGNLWRRIGIVHARPARAGETVETLEGRVTAANGDWVVRGERGEKWTMSAAEFTRRYEGPFERHSGD